MNFVPTLQHITIYGYNYSSYGAILEELCGLLLPDGDGYKSVDEGLAAEAVPCQLYSVNAIQVFIGNEEGAGDEIIVEGGGKRVRRCGQLQHHRLFTCR